MTTKRRKRRKSCKHGKLKRPVPTKKGGKRRCKKNTRRSRKRKSKRKYKMYFQGPGDDCPPGMIEDIQNCGIYTPCKDQNGVCKTKRGQRLSEVMSLQELATRRLLKSNSRRHPVFTLNYNLPNNWLPPLAPKGYYLTSPTYPGRQIQVRSNQTMKDMEERDIVTTDLLHSLIYESEEGNIDLIRLLIQRGADVNKKDDFGRTPIMYASYTGQTEVVRILLDNGAYVNEIDSQDITALMLASQGEQDNTDTVKLLIDRRADVNMKDNTGNTALMFAIRGGANTEIVKMLLYNGADVNVQNEITKQPPLLYASSVSITEIVKMLIQRGADVHKQNKFGYTALIEASRKGKIDIVKLLIYKKVDLNVKDSYGNTAIMFAHSNKHTEIVRLLRKYGAEI